MFQRMLVPLDDTIRTEAALRIASGIAQQTGGQLVLMRSEPRTAPAQRVISARTALQRQVNALRQQGLQAEYAVEVGSREAGIVAAARDRQVDLILLVPTHRQHLELLWYSRSAVHLLQELPAPLLIWPESQTSAELLVSPEATVMVPLEDTPEAARSLRFAGLLAQRYHSPLVLVRAVPTVADEMCRDSVRGAGCFSDKVEEARAHLDAAREHVAKTMTTPVRTAVVVGEPGTQLVHAAKTYRAGAIVLCSHSQPTKQRYFLGCVATQLLHQADVPLLIVPPNLDALNLATDQGNMIAYAHSEGDRCDAMSGTLCH